MSSTWRRALLYLGLGPDELRAADPKLIYVSVSAYGASGPFAHRPGLDPVLHARRSR